MLYRSFSLCMVMSFMLSCTQQTGTTAEQQAPVPPADSMMPVGIDTVPDPDPTDTFPGSAYLEPSVSPETEQLVRQALASMYKEDLAKNLIDSFSRRFTFFEFDLDGVGQKEIFVAFRGPYFCGTGGCNILLLNHLGSKISEFTVADVPVVIDNKRTEGYNDLFIQSGGKWHVLKFTKKGYPSNVSLQPVLNIIPGDGLPRALEYTVTPYPWYRF